MTNVKVPQIRQFRPSEKETGLRVSLLGPLKVEQGGAPLAIGSRKARGLLGYLVRRNGLETARSTLAGLLWGGRGEEQARASLRQTLSEIRGAFTSVSENPIDANRHAVTWKPGSAWVDTKELADAVASGDDDRLVETAPLLRGEFLEGLSIDESSFDHWLAGEREHFRQLSTILHKRLMECAEAGGDLATALNHGQALISSDPLQEQIHRSLMRIYAAQGRHDAALAQFERCRSELADQLGVRPEAETEALASSIRAGRRGAPASANTRSHPTNSHLEKPSIAVLPFVNLSGDREQEFFADGMTEDIIGALSHIKDLFVISRSSSFTYKDRTVLVQEAARQLGVRHILEGSVRASGTKVRVTAKLIDGQSGGHLWAERYDGDLGDIFSFQDEITRNIALAMQVNLTHGQSIRLWEGRTNNLQAWEKMVLARDLFLRFNAADNKTARHFLEEALIADRNFTGAMALLGLTHWWDARYNRSLDKEECLCRAEREARRIFDVDPDMAAAFMLDGAVALLRRDYELAVEKCQKAVDLAPGDSHNLGFLGLVKLFDGQSDQAVSILRITKRLDPHVPAWCTYNLAMALLWTGRLSEAHETARTYLLRKPDDVFGHVSLAAIQDFQGRETDASATVTHIKDRFPEFGTGHVRRAEPYKEQEKLDRMVEILRRLGIGE